MEKQGRLKKFRIKGKKNRDQPTQAVPSKSAAGEGEGGPKGEKEARVFHGEAGALGNTRKSERRK